ncbi:DNA-binding PucR family transcriptional regulator [Alkalihalobacillus xiaoxiensis]|uniref:DNA-binding PucR family transcriptional regulator n=1 Tax=Shouchella xiaoxiensis TaxID=766895 RepID=A0ABS2T2N3_9BACI|nr:helix-turn-helix domain-containing protein [Shouchella xiaoxiensis]MBM7840732.1 DNA-binding PucR family transcriptional regulator [Shouchella xiaoxiensis]
MTNVPTHLFNQPFDSLDDFADAISEHLHCPVTIEDSNHQLLAYSSHEDETDAARISTIIGRRVPERVINRFWKDGVIPTLNKSDEPLVIPTINEIGLGNRVAISIRKNEEVLGYIWVLEVGRSLTNQDLADLKIAALKARNQLLQLNLQTKRKERNDQELLWQMMTGDVSDQTSIKSHLQRLGLKHNHALAIMVFSFESITKAQYRQLTYATKTLQRIDILIQTLDENEFILLVSPNSVTDFDMEAREFIHTFSEQVKERFQLSILAAGCSYPKESFDDVKTSYKEARTVIQLKQLFKRELHKSFFYHELGVFRYIDILKRSNETKELATNHAIQKLQAYDQEHRANLLETLEAVLDREDNMAEAAKLLHCHVNTLNYRLKRIKEITLIDIKDPVQKIGIYLDMKLFRNGK